MPPTACSICPASAGKLQGLLAKIGLGLPDPGAEDSTLPAAPAGAESDSDSEPDELLHSTLHRAHLKQLSAALVSQGAAACVLQAPGEQLQAVLLKLAALVAKFTGTCLHAGDTVGA